MYEGLFGDQLLGYDKQQVDEFIQKIFEEHSKTVQTLLEMQSQVSENF